MTKNLTTRFSIKRFLKLIRFGNLLLLIFTQYFAAVFLVGPKENWFSIITDWNLLLITLSTFFIAAAGYIINDYYDIKIDIINKPSRVVVGKDLTRRMSLFTHTAFNILGIFLGLLISWKIAAIDLFAAFYLWLYSNALKRFPLIGNIAVSILTSLSILILAIYYKKNISLIIIFSVFAFFISLIREIVKDMEDIKGDAAFGCKTLPLVYGIRKTKNIIYFLILIFLLSLFLLGKEVNDGLIIYFIILILSPLAFLLVKLSTSDSSKDFHFLSKLCKFIMVAGVISMIFI